MMSYRCKWCHGQNRLGIRLLRERMFGDGTTHPYEECVDCGSLQLADPIPDLSPFYPAPYGAHEKIRRHRAWRKLARGLRARLAWYWPFAPDDPWAGRLHLPAVILQLRDVLPRDRMAPILDVGCGNGYALLHLADLGFRALTGIDPFVREDLHYDVGVVVWRRTLGEHRGAYDLIMSHHSLEHVADVDAALREMRRLVKPAGRLAIRLPIVGGIAWKEYGDDWVQLDPPRHLCLPTERGFRAAAARHGLAIDSITYDSSQFQFWGSEWVRRGRSLVDPGSGRGPTAREFPIAQRREWTRRTREANVRGEGDQALFVLRPVT